MNSVTPFLWFADNNAEEAVNYYRSVFPDSRVISIQRYPDASLSEHFAGMEGKVLTAEITLNGQRLLVMDGGPNFRLSEAFSLLVECENQEEIDYYWERLSHVPDAEACGWCKDRFGVSWQIVPKHVGDMVQNDAAVRAMMDMKKLDIARLEAASKAG